MSDLGAELELRVAAEASLVTDALVCGMRMVKQNEYKEALG